MAKIENGANQIGQIIFCTVGTGVKVKHNFIQLLTSHILIKLLAPINNSDGVKKNSKIIVIVAGLS